MNRLHEALAHLLSGLSILGKNQPRSDFGCYMMILKESLRHYLHVFLPGYYIGEAGYVSLSIQLSFSFIASNMWNKPPLYIRNPNNLKVFKKAKQNFKLRSLY